MPSKVLYGKIKRFSYNLIDGKNRSEEAG